MFKHLLRTVLDSGGCFKRVVLSSVMRIKIGTIIYSEVTMF